MEEFPHIDKLFNLEDRKYILEEHDKNLIYICQLMQQFVNWVQYAKNISLDASGASNLAFNLYFTICNELEWMRGVEMVQGIFLLKDEYEQNCKNLDKFKKFSSLFLLYVEQLYNEGYFDTQPSKEKFYELFDNAYILDEEDSRRTGGKYILNIQRQISGINGNRLLIILNANIQFLETWLTKLKTNQYLTYDIDYEEFYKLNYELYRREYWTKDCTNFRANVKMLLRNHPQTPEALDKLLWDEQTQFCTNPVGEAWRDSAGNKEALYSKARYHVKWSVEQWRYFFKQVCRFEEYEKWIEELKNPNKQDPNIGEDTPININEKIVACFTERLLNVEEPSLLYFLMLAMWARRLLQSREITSFVKMVGEIYPAIYSEERTQERVIMSLQNMNGKSVLDFADNVKDQSSMITFIESMYPKKKNGGRRKECERVVNLAEKLFLALN